MASKLDSLRSFLSKVQPGRIGVTHDLEQHLARSWEELSGEVGNMEGSKVIGRIEHVTWSPPILTFTIERHGGTVLGSVYAATQYWTVDIANGTASLEPGESRLVGARERPLRIEPLTEEVVKLVVSGKDDPRLKWHSASKVRVLISKILPKGPTAQKTLIGRRRRLARAIEESLSIHGWERVSTQHIYERQSCSRVRLQVT